jgi:hypothetical protein
MAIIKKTAFDVEATNKNGFNAFVPVTIMVRTHKESYYGHVSGKDYYEWVKQLNASRRESIEKLVNLGGILASMHTCRFDSDWDDDTNTCEEWNEYFVAFKSPSRELFDEINKVREKSYIEPSFEKIY